MGSGSSGPYQTALIVEGHPIGGLNLVEAFLARVMVLDHGQIRGKFSLQGVDIQACKSGAQGAVGLGVVEATGHEENIPFGVVSNLILPG